MFIEHKSQDGSSLRRERNIALLTERRGQIDFSVPRLAELEFAPSRSEMFIEPLRGRVKTILSSAAG